MQDDDDTDYMLRKTLDKVSKNSIIGSSCRTETFGFRHLRQGESNIPLTQELTEILSNAFSGE